MLLSKEESYCAIVESDSYKREYVDDLVKDWNSQLRMFPTVAESQPQAA